MSLYRYVVVGAVATAVHYAVLVALVDGLAVPPAAASFTGACAGAVVAFVGQRAFTFFDRARTFASVPRFMSVAIFGALINGSLVWAGTALGLHYLLAQVAATALVVVLSYHLNNRWTFA